MTRTQVYLNDNTHLQVQLLAKSVNKPAAALIRKYVESGVRNDLAKRESPREALLRLAKIGKRVKKGPRDLSTRHDYYLYGES